jgi:hypothetical protein
MTEDQVKQEGTEEQAEQQGQESDKQSPTLPPEGDPGDQEDGRTPPPEDLSEDPAYEPEDESLKDIKGG